MKNSQQAFKLTRPSFGRLPEIMPVPYLLGIQVDSYAQFLQQNVPLAKRTVIGIEKILQDIFPIQSANGNVELCYKKYEFGSPLYDETECRNRSKTFAVPLWAHISLIFRGPKKEIRLVRESEQVYLGDIPMMTERGNFIVNGTERVIVSQLHRSPGVIFAHDSGKSHSSGKLLYSARIIPNRGSWLDFEFDHQDYLYVRIDRRSKLPVTTLLKSMNMNSAEILATFFDNQHYTVLDGDQFELELVPERLQGQSMDFDIRDKKGKLIVASGQRIRKDDIIKMKTAGIDRLVVQDNYLCDQVLATDIPDPETGEIAYAANKRIDREVLLGLRSMGIEQFDTIYTNDLDCGSFISDTLREDPAKSSEDALIEIYRVMRPGNPPTLEEAGNLFQNLFRSEVRYDLSDVGRMKFNRRLGIKEEIDENSLLTLRDSDIIEVLRKLIALRNGYGMVDDIDNLGNRRVRSVGEMAENQFRIGLLRIERAVKERLNNAEQENLTPKDLISAKPITGALKDFFGWSPLSQFMDQNNPLAEVTHKRRVSALGPGGLMRGRAGFEVRDVHPTHYGRLCPIETPEGPNIGLINSLALYSRTNRYGFLETPYRKITKKRVTRQIDYLSAINESEFVIAQASAELDEKGKFSKELVAARQHDESTLTAPERVQYMDVSPQQAVSAAASLVPFLEHDDANRALMGANMQRQAVPLLNPHSPMVGTGLEHIVARDAGGCLVARRGGVVENVNARRIAIRVNEDEINGNSPEVVDIYNLIKYCRSNQNTSLNQRPVVKKGEVVERGGVLADGAAVQQGELALGQNMRIAFMPWNGYNYEDSILISERVVRGDYFTSVHIQELTCSARETKQGDEEITSDIPNISESARTKLDESGIICIGAEVVPGDILVGRVTPKTETRQTLLEKLLQAVFDDKAADVKDTSLKVPSGVRGTVVDVQVFVRDLDEKKHDVRAAALDEEQIGRVHRDQEEELRIVKEVITQQVHGLLLDKTVLSGGGLKRNTVLTDKILEDIGSNNWMSLTLAEPTVDKQLKAAGKHLKDYEKKLQGRCEARIRNIEGEDDLPSNVIKQVKVSIAVKRKIQPGDKMAGRHGNKGVISMVVPVEDMPFDSNGEPVDIVLNPLGVPSRMNVGQVLEAHLGLALHGVGNRLNQMVEQHQSLDQIRSLLTKVFAVIDTKIEVDKLSKNDIDILLQRFCKGMKIATPVFDGCSEAQIKELLKLVDLPASGQLQLYDGRSGEPYDRLVTVGYMYMMKLNHLVDDKMHARSTGSYSLVTQQPLGGKAQFGGQRLGEMEVWALEAYGAAYTLREMLTVKSDDMAGRNQIYKDIVDRNYDQSIDLPESFNVLTREIRALGIDIELERSSMRNSSSNT